jgi:hypothetical protein
MKRADRSSAAFDARPRFRRRQILAARSDPTKHRSSAMAKPEIDPERERRIRDEIVVDAHDAGERA